MRRFMRRRSRNGDRRRYWGKVERSDFRGFGSISRFTVAIEDNAVLFHVGVSNIEPASMHALSENIAAFTTKGAAAASKETEKIPCSNSPRWYRSKCSEAGRENAFSSFLETLPGEVRASRGTMCVGIASPLWSSPVSPSGL